MRVPTGSLRTGAFAALVAGSLGFGATQVVAAPRAEGAREGECQSICVFQCGAPGGREIIRGGPCICCRPG